ncbi:uncharacterized protein RAG0_01352 [Rhynchosporium agropyri]|uniref:PHD-type domain-containing protein n=1 Tax=Rhynchosporium agropyri TaxID=914238 RepID=A0A1E1JWM4_9HELO|nr:uncharacterized protein RAG0_01352 [Rhynchosporium agropyri]
MASSPPPTILTSKRLESLSGKEIALRKDLDDASSITSMSSFSRAIVCRICKGPERLTAPLIACIGCKSRYHMACPNPRIIDTLSDYTCTRCSEKAASKHNANRQKYKRTKELDDPARVRGESKVVRDILNEKSATKTDRFIMDNIKLTKELAGPTRTRGVSKAAQDNMNEKSVIKTDRSIIDNIKWTTEIVNFARNREPKAAQQDTSLKTTVEPRGTSDIPNPTTTHSSSIVMCKGENCPGRPAQSGNLGSLCFMCGVMERHKKVQKTAKPVPAVAPRITIKKNKLYPVRPDDRPLVKKRKRISSSTGSASKPTRFDEECQNAGALKPIPDPDKKITVTSSLVSACAQLCVDEGSAMASLHRSRTQAQETFSGAASPRITFDIEPNKEVLEAINVPKVKHNKNSDLGLEVEETFLREEVAPKGTLTSVEGCLTPEISFRYPKKPSQDSQSDERLDEEKKNRLEDLPPLQEKLSFEVSSPEPPFPVSEASSEHVPSPMVLDFEALGKYDHSYGNTTQVDESGEYQLKPYAPTSGFDETILDSFLRQQSHLMPTHQPTSKELLETQIWSAGDPRPFWPRRLSPAQKAEKMLEIEARGSRKSRIGKILHPQLLKEKADKGWDVHQTREKRDNPEALEMVQKMEELFCVREGTLRNCVPTTVDGQLAMQERREPQYENLPYSSPAIFLI